MQPCPPQTIFRTTAPNSQPASIQPGLCCALQLFLEGAKGDGAYLITANSTTISDGGVVTVQRCYRACKHTTGCKAFNVHTAKILINNTVAADAAKKAGYGNGASPWTCSKQRGLTAV